MGAIRPRQWPLAPRDRAWDGDAAVDRIRRWAGGPEKDEIDWERYRQCFLWYDEEAPEAFGSYKLPYVDVLDGGPHIVYRALVAIRAVLSGARGGVDIPEADQEELRGLVDSLIARFDEGERAVDGIERRGLRGSLTLRSEEGRPRRIVGRAIVFDEETVIQGAYREIIRRQAVESALERDTDVAALWQHDPAYVLGRRSAGTLRLEVRDDGLWVEIDPPDTQWARDALVSIERGDVWGMSFGFNVIADRWYGDGSGMPLREVTDLELYDVSPVTYPAYPATSVAVREMLRSLAGPSGAGAPVAPERRSGLRRRWLELMQR